MNAKQAQAKRQKMAERARHQKELHFPEVHEDFLWHRSRNDGYTTVPRTMPIVMEIVDALSKGHPAGHVLLTLWCRAPDHALVTIENPSIMASEAGFSGLRKVDSWRRRMGVLKDLGLLYAKPGSAGDFHYVLLTNPNWFVQWRHKLFKDVPNALYVKFMDRISEVGAFSEITAVNGHIERWQKESAAADAATEETTQEPPPPVPEPEIDGPTLPTQPAGAAAESGPVIAALESAPCPTNPTITQA